MYKMNQKLQAKINGQWIDVKVTMLPIGNNYTTLQVATEDYRTYQVELKNIRTPDHNSSDTDQSQV